MMTSLRVLVSRFIGLFSKGRLEQELDEEMRSHLEMLVDENMRKGMSAEEARYAARRSFGAVEQVKETYRERRGLPMIETFWQDTRYGLRQLRRSPGFTTAAVLTLALGIGANTAIFSLIDAILLKMLPVREPERLVLLGTLDLRGRNESFSYPVYEKLRDRNEVFSGMFAFDRLARWSVSVDGHAELVVGQLVSGSYHLVLGVNPVAGRMLSPEDDRDAGAPAMAVISYGYWKRRFGLDPSAVGKAVRINGAPFTIVGVTPPGFFGVSVGSAPDLTVPLAMEAAIQGGRTRVNETGFWWAQIMARLKPGVTEQQALASMSVVFRQILDKMTAETTDQRQIRELREMRIELLPASKGIDIMRRRFSEPLRLLAAVVGLVLLIACANIANLLLARAAARQREIAVRLAVGATRTRLIRQLLTESAMLAITGGLLGVWLAQWGGRLILSLAGAGPDPILIDLQPDLRVLGFTAAVALFTGVLFGLEPAYRATDVNANPVLAEGSVRGAHRTRLSKVLVVAQVGLSLLLLIGSGLFVRTLQNLKGIGAGFNRHNLMVFSINPVLTGYPPDSAARLYTQVLDRVEAIPGVHSASVAVFGPLDQSGAWGTRVSVPGFVPRSEEEMTVEMNLVGARFFETVGIPVLAGRSFGTTDQQNQAKVVVINDTMARQYFGNENPLGRSITVNDMEGEIVGLVNDVRWHSLRDRPSRKVYMPFPMSGAFSGQASFAVRASGDVSNLMARVRKEVNDLDPNLPLYDIKTMTEQIDQSLSQERLLATLATFFGLLALLLVCVGLYGVISYRMVRRTNEIGIRMALGAQQSDVLWMVLRETLTLIVIGVAIGLPAALAATRLTTSMLFGLTPTDPFTISSATLLLTAVCAFAGYLPARRAARVDPMVALRYE